MLPFQTMQEAEHSLGRPLTCAERLWFRYSAQTHDLWLYCHTALLLFLVYTLAPLPLALLEIRRFRWLHDCKLQPQVQLSSVAFLKCYKDVMRTLILAVGPLQFVSYPAFKWVGIRTGLPLPQWREILLQIGVYFFIEDYGNYWLHRTLHCKWVFEKIHRVHHEFKAPMGFAAYYAHWSEILILGFPSLVGPAIVPGHIITFWLWMVLRQIEIIHTHCGYILPHASYFWIVTQRVLIPCSRFFFWAHHDVCSKSNWRIRFLCSLPPSISKCMMIEASGGSQ